MLLHTAPGQGIGTFIFDMTGMALDPVPFQLMACAFGIQRLPQIHILDRFLGGGFPATRLPVGQPLEQALAHYADHCAACHANNGSGETTMGRSMYPRVPDMRIEKTQSLSDGELFSIIEHGIRLTGMPGWGNGTPEGESESWGLVHFVRRLPKLTDEDIERMEALNPKSPSQFKEEEEARRFLEGAK